MRSALRNAAPVRPGRAPGARIALGTVSLALLGATLAWSATADGEGVGSSGAAPAVAPPSLAPSVLPPLVEDPVVPVPRSVPPTEVAPPEPEAAPAAEVAAPPPAVAVAPAAPPAAPPVVERSTTTIELFLAEDPSANSATMIVGPSPGVDQVRLELLADPPAAGNSVAVQVRVTNDSDAAISFPDSMTVTIFGERDGRTVAEAVLRLPGVTRLIARSGQLLTGEIVLSPGTTTLRAEMPIQIEPGR